MRANFCPHKDIIIIVKSQKKYQRDFTATIVLTLMIKDMNMTLNAN